MHDLLAVSKALSDATRVRLLAACVHAADAGLAADVCACQLIELVGLAPSTVSLHIKELKRAGLVSERKDGRWVYFTLSDDAHASPWLETALAAVDGDPELERDAALVAELRRLPVADLCSLGYEAAKAKLEKND